MPILRERRYFLIAYVLQIAALLAVIIPFLRFNNLLEWDFPGHYAAIWHLKQNLLPWPTGWNPYFYCGYPQGIFYPPATHFLAALLSFPLGIAGSMKACITISLLVLPASFYFFCSRFGLDDLQAAVGSTWMTALLFISGELLGTWSFGADLRSILNVGLFSNTLSLPLLFVFFVASSPSIGPRNWKRSALLLGILFLTHPLSALIGVFFLVSTGIAQSASASYLSAENWRIFLRVPAVAVMLGSFWIIPYASFRDFMNTGMIPAQWSAVVQLIVFNGLILALQCRAEKQLRPLLLLYVLIANFIIIGSLWQIGLQFTRLTIYLLFLIPVFLVSRIQSRPLLLALAGLAVMVGFYGYRYSGIKPRGVPDFAIPDFGKVGGRILSVAPGSHLPSYHVNHDPIPVATGNEATLGLFIEGSLNGKFLGNLMRSLEPEAYIWGTPTEVVTPGILGNEYAGYIRERLNLFGIRYIYTDLRLEYLLGSPIPLSKRYLNSYPAPRLKSPQETEAFTRRYHLREGMLDFFLYDMGSGALAEALPYVPSVPSSDWKLTSRQWFLEMRGVPVFTDRPIPAGVRAALPGESLENIIQSEGGRTNLVQHPFLSAHTGSGKNRVLPDMGANSERETGTCLSCVAEPDTGFWPRRCCAPVSASLAGIRRPRHISYWNGVFDIFIVMLRLHVDWSRTSNR